MLDLLKILLVPSSLGALLFALGAIALALPATRRAARPLLLASGTVLFVFSTGPVATLLLAPLEYEYPAMTEPERHAGIGAIVVLTAYASADADMPLSSRMNSSSAFRVLEAANLAHLRPDCSVIVSGNEIAARVMGQQLQVLGVAPERIVLDTASGNTSASAENLAAKLGGESVFLVTSAGHMRRSLAVFRRRGIEAIPVPADHQLPADVSSAEWTVSPFNLQASNLAIHEYTGLLWYWLTDRI